MAIKRETVERTRVEAFEVVVEGAEGAEAAIVEGMDRLEDIVAREVDMVELIKADVEVDKVKFDELDELEVVSDIELLDDDDDEDNADPPPVPIAALLNVSTLSPLPGFTIITIPFVQ